MSDKSPHGHARAIGLIKVAGAMALVALWTSAVYWHIRAPKPQFVFAAPIAVPIAVPNYPSMSFQTLSSFHYESQKQDDDRKLKFYSPPKPPGDQIPASVKALSGQKIAIQGFMLPSVMKEGRAAAFLLLRNPVEAGSCAGFRIPRMNEWISVHMKAQTGTRILLSQPVTIYGTLSVGEQTEDGEVLNIYRVDDCEDVAGPFDL